MELALLLLFCGSLCVSDVFGKAAIPAKRFKVDLDEPATKRWRPVLEHFDRSLLQAVIDTLENQYIKSKLLVKLAYDIGNYVEKYIPQPYADEMVGIAEFYNVTVGEIVLSNLAYDISAWNTEKLRNMFGCTSIVAVDSTGKVIHGRNLDYAASDNLRDVTVEVEFHHSGKTSFIATTFVGYVGVLTGVKPGAFSISGDQRNTGSFVENIISAFEKHWPTLLMSREVIMHADSYDSAVYMLAKADTIAPMYFIVGGMKPHEGAIVVRGRSGAVNITTMQDTPHKWFVLETNYDPWKRPPDSDDRRDTGVYAMEVFGQDRMNFDNLYGVLSIPPVFNSDTTYTTVMSAADPSAYRTRIRYDHPDV